MVAKKTAKAPDRAKPRKAARPAIENDVVLRHWLHAVPNDRLAHLIKDATRGLVRSLQRRLVEHSVSFGHWTFLRILWEQDGLTQRELSEQAGVMEPTALAALHALEKLGYVERKKRPGDAKKIHVTLTPAGRDLKRKLVPLAEEVNRIALRGVPRSHVGITRRTLLAVVENLAIDEAEARDKPARRLKPLGKNALPDSRTRRRVSTAGDGAS